MRRQLAATQQSLAETEKQLSAARTDLAAEQARVLRTEADLAESKQRVAELEAELREVRGIGCFGAAGGGAPRTCCSAAAVWASCRFRALPRASAFRYCAGERGAQEGKRGCGGGCGGEAGRQPVVVGCFVA